MSRRIQIILLIFVVLIGLRIYFIYRSRNAPATTSNAPVANPNFSADDYVVPTQVHAYDLKSAKEALDGKTVWVKAGNQVYFYPYSGSRVDFQHAAGLLLPLEKLGISNVVQATPPGTKAEEVSPGVRVRAEQVLAVFHKGDDKKSYAAPIGGNHGGDYTLYINETFYFEDPHQLYKYWPADVWSAIDQHQAKVGMNELQVALALGIGVPTGSGDYGNRTLQFDNNGRRFRMRLDRS
jgi:hypothetical protein